MSWPSVSLGLGALLLLGACASLAPEGYPLDLSAQGLRRTDLPAGEGTQWDYILVIKNPNRRPATLIQEAVTLGWDGVYRVRGPELERPGATDRRPGARERHVDPVAVPRTA